MYLFKLQREEQEININKDSCCEEHVTVNLTINKKELKINKKGMSIQCN